MTKVVCNSSPVIGLSIIKKLDLLRYCEKHQKQVDRKYSRMNRPFKHLYNTSRWKKLRKQFLQEHPICVKCKAKGVIKAAAVVDHVRAHKGNERLFWDESNWQPLCKSCHDRKTAREDGSLLQGKCASVNSLNI
ncbi:HNH endonuclease [Clostridium sp. BJN0013]|uniref:HNH endonuclease n=1 Tax=Clostridium sp. BJN0013 TaxID=3236840 RepID=UPI0034C5D252